MSESPSIEALAARLTALEDERAILGTMYRYGRCLDYGHENEWADCFTEDGSFVAGQIINCQGREQLLAFAKAHTRAPAKYHKHIVISPLIEINGDTAHATSYYARIDNDDEGGHPYVRAAGLFRDELLRCPDGAWRFRSRHAEA